MLERPAAQHAGTPAASVHGLLVQGVLIGVLLTKLQHQAIHSPRNLWLPGRQVSLHCGVEEALANVSEPNRCEYVARLVTPAACTPELVALARREYEEAERELAAVHDEL